jgi:hypothetical protein
MTEYEQRLQQRIDSMPPFKRAFFDLDAVLTGKPPLEVVTQYHHYPDDAVTWLEKESSGSGMLWYLSDSGYSRVFFDLDSGKLYLASESRQEVKDRWNDPSARDLRALLEGIIHQQLQDALAAGKDIWYSPPESMKEQLPEPPRNELPESKIKGGKGDKLKPEDVDPEELEMGITVEVEHKKGDREAAQDIALDHLAEDPHYYTKLKKCGLADELRKLAASKKEQKEQENQAKKKRVKENARRVARALLFEGTPFPVCPLCEQEQGVPTPIPPGHDRVESICQRHLERTKGRWPGHEEAARLRSKGLLAPSSPDTTMRAKACFYPGATGST